METANITYDEQGNPYVSHSNFGTQPIQPQYRHLIGQPGVTWYEDGSGVGGGAGSAAGGTPDNPRTIDDYRAGPSGYQAPAPSATGGYQSPAPSYAPSTSTPAAGIARDPGLGVPSTSPNAQTTGRSATSRALNKFSNAGGMSNPRTANSGLRAALGMPSAAMPGTSRNAAPGAPSAAPSPGVVRTASAPPTPPPTPRLPGWGAMAPPPLEPSMPGSPPPMALPANFRDPATLPTGRRPRRR